MKKLFRKLINKKGETLIETLVAVLMICAIFTGMAAAIVSAAKVNSKVENYNQEFTVGENKGDVDVSFNSGSSDTDPISVQISATEKESKNDYVYYSGKETAKGKYTVRWQYEDGRTIDEKQYGYGEYPFTDATPEAKEGMAFTGWNPGLQLVTGNMVYTAVYQTTQLDSIIINIPTDTVFSYDGTEHFARVTTEPSDANVEYDVTPSRTEPGIQNVSVTASKSGYKTATASYSIIVNRVEVTVSALNSGKAYGEDDPELSAIVSGVYGEDQIKYSISRKNGENVGDYTITPYGDAIQGYYSVTFVPATFTISKSKILSLNVAGYKGEYDGKDHVVSAAANVTEGTSISYSTDGGKTWTNTVPSVKNVCKEIVVDVKAENTNYETAYGQCALEVDYKSVTVKADDKSKEYGKEDPLLTATVSGTIGNDTVDYSLSRADGEKIGSYTITPQGASTQGNYSITFETGNLVITAKKVTVTANSLSKTYGDNDPKLTAVVTGAENGDTIRYIIERVPGENVGTYTITPSGDRIQGNYEVEYVTGTFTITRKTITVKADDKSKVYGETDPRLTATVSGLVGEDSVSYTVTRAEGENIGEYTITVSGDTVQGNYNVNYKTGVFTITSKYVTVSADNKEKTYGQGDPGLTATVTGLVGDDTVEYTISREAGENVGTYTITPAGEEIQGNYTVSYATGTLTIKSKAVTVTADNKEKTFGEGDPGLTATVTGLVGDDTVEYTLSREAGENVGTYTITPAGDTVQGNYTVEYKTGLFTIKPKTVTVEADNKEKTFGQDDPVFTAKVTGLVGTDTIEYTLSRTAGENVGTYTITPTGDAMQGNYSVTYISSTLKIKPKAVIVTATGDSKQYGDDDPEEFSIDVDGTISGDTIEYTVTRKLGEDVGTYVITPSGAAEQGNYTVTYKQGIFEITRREIKVTADNKVKFYGEADPALTVKVETLVGADTIAYTLSRDSGENIGEYTITVSGDSEQGNYHITYSNGIFTIQGPFVITLNNQEATTAGTSVYYERYNVGNYANLACTQTISKITVPTKYGYSFSGYYTGENGQGTKYISEAGTITANKTTFNADTTLYANWTPNKHTVFVKNLDNTDSMTVTVSGVGSASIGGKIQNVPYGATITVTAVLKNPWGDYNTRTVLLRDPNAGSSSEQYYDIVVDNDSRDTNTANYKINTTFTMMDQDVAVAGYAGDRKNPCIAEGTMITLADGSKKAVEDITAEDKVLVFNHETGKLDSAEMSLMVHNGLEAEDRTVMTFVFDDGTELRAIGDHGLFEVEKREYVYIDADNYEDYIGRSFFKESYADGQFISSEVKLVNVNFTEDTIRYYAPISKYHLNYFADDMLSMTSLMEGLFNIFELDENMKYDEVKMQEDIEKYGLFTYEDYIPYGVYPELYDYFPSPYFKVSIGKGMITIEHIFELANEYFTEENFLK